MIPSTQALLAVVATLGTVDKVWLSAGLILSGVLIIAWPVLARFARGLRRPQRSVESLDHRAEKAVGLARERIALDDLTADVREITRLCAAQLDERARRAEQLIALADARILRLEGLLAEQPSDRHATTDQPEPDAREPGPRPGHAAATPPVTVRHVSPASIPVPSLAVTVPAAAGIPVWPGAALIAEEADPMARQICELADQGYSAVQIAGKLEEHVGKVELILALRRR